MRKYASYAPHRIHRARRQLLASRRRGAALLARRLLAGQHADHPGFRPVGIRLKAAEDLFVRLLARQTSRVQRRRISDPSIAIRGE
ncbi:MAG: hypothetical protein J0J11_05335, partial [Microbacterium sp.]|nr:hypothetical protein [Microbacterium sp.]